MIPHFLHGRTEPIIHQMAEQNAKSAAELHFLYFVGRLVYDRLCPAVKKMWDDGAQALFLRRSLWAMDDFCFNDPLILFPHLKRRPLPASSMTGVRNPPRPGP